MSYSSISSELEWILKDSMPERWLLFRIDGILFRLETLRRQCRIELESNPLDIERDKLVILERAIEDCIRMTIPRGVVPAHGPELADFAVE